MTYDEAMEQAVLGARVRANDMQPGAYIDYQFNGFRINFAGGTTSSFWTATDLDRAAEWEEVPIGTLNNPLQTFPGVERDKWGRPL